MKVKTDYESICGWYAWFEEMEESSPVAYGRNRGEAIQNLMYFLRNDGGAL